MDSVLQDGAAGMDLVKTFNYSLLSAEVVKHRAALSKAWDSRMRYVRAQHHISKLLCQRETVCQLED